MEYTRIICQSCGMPLKKEGDFGTEIDGTKNMEYCHYCYNSGQFTDEGITLADKIEKLVSISQKNLGMTEVQAREMASKILPNLKRWKN